LAIERRASVFRTMKPRYWTPERDEEMKRLEAAGLSASQIAVLLHTTRGAVLGRSNNLRGKLFKSEVERAQRDRIAAAERRAKKHADRNPGLAAMEANLEAEKRETAAIFDALRADLAAGIERDAVIKRALRVGIVPAAIGTFFGLSIAQVHQIAGLREGPRRWTKERVELLLSMWPNHSASEIAAALGTTPDGVYRKRKRLGLSRRRSKNNAGEPEHSPAYASAAAPA
jgi:hypothetical protein